VFLSAVKDMFYSFELISEITSGIRVGETGVNRMQRISSNFFLDSLSLESRRILMDLATTVSLPLGTILHEAQVIPDHAFLLTSGIASTITKTRNGDSAEVGLIGHEGVVGSLQLLGPAPVLAESMIQIDATALLDLLTRVQEDLSIVGGNPNPAS
jgi:hypothetical protein